jgi:CBS domain-containing protein
MHTNDKPFLNLTAEDVMSRHVVTISAEMSLPAAAQLLSQNQVNAAPVVDAEGRCVGVLSVSDIVRWAEERACGAGDGPTPVCSYQVKGRLLTGEEAVICTLAAGACPLQVMRPTTGGRETAVCLLPTGVHCDWQQLPGYLPDGTVHRHMTANVITVRPQTPLPEVARIMNAAHVHQLIVADATNCPVGVVSSTDLVAAAVARAEPAEAALAGGTN